MGHHWSMSPPALGLIHYKMIVVVCRAHIAASAIQEELRQMVLCSLESDEAVRARGLLTEKELRFSPEEKLGEMWLISFRSRRNTGLQDECQYLLQPQLIVRRLLDVAVLVPGRPSEQILSPHNRSALYKVFVPSFTYRVSAQLACVGGRGVSACPLSLRLRPKAPPLYNSSSVACGGASGCQLELALPPWGHWVYVRVETSSRGSGRTIRFQLCVRLQGQNPTSAPVCADIRGWEVTWVAVFSGPLPHPYNLPSPTQAPSCSLKPSHLELQVIGRPLDNFFCT
ncbi:hypothetical protein P7K49_001358 [Saguinus oedipus]|uniref:Uncharacterized protein n=1 Tax=Saguinus oedipus TaxID=9490 RepID=A0ABQ9WEA0_SAGOE|nr:hypothetical protein P7K49_001358 [Saguinus oedipus]